MSVVVLHFILQCSIWSLYRYCFLVHLCMSYLRQASLRDNWHCTSSYHPCDLTVPNYYFEERRCCSLVHCYCPLSSLKLCVSMTCVSVLLDITSVRAQQASKWYPTRQKHKSSIHGDLCFCLDGYRLAYSLCCDTLSVYCLLVNLYMSYDSIWT